MKFFCSCCLIAASICQSIPAATTGLPWVARKEKRAKVKGEEKRAGLEIVDRRLEMGNLAFGYHLLVNPKTGDRPVVERYGDYRFSCEFPLHTWNWNLEYFMAVFVKRLKGRPLVANRATLQEGIFIVENGPRAVADLVWPLSPEVKTPETRTASELPGKLAVRVVKRSRDERWFFMEISLESKSPPPFSKVRLMGYPYVTTGPVERQRWVSTLKAGYVLNNGPAEINPAETPGLVLHNRRAQETGGGLLIFDPNEIEQVRCTGTYGVSVDLFPQPGIQKVHLAVGYFWKEHYTNAVRRFRQDCGKMLAQLRQTDWTAYRDRRAWDIQERALEQLFAIQTMPEETKQKWRELRESAGNLIGRRHAGPNETPLSREQERQYTRLLEEVQSFRERAFAEALEILTKP